MLLDRMGEAAKDLVILGVGALLLLARNRLTNPLALPLRSSFSLGDLGDLRAYG